MWITLGDGCKEEEKSGGSNVRNAIPDFVKNILNDT